MVNVIGVIGATGLIGKHLSNHINPDASYTSKNIETLSNNKFNVLYCAAPSGNRLDANINPKNDFDTIGVLTSQLLKVKTNQFVLISTVDTLHSPTTAYGGNRLILENFVKQNFSNNIVIRLPTLIDQAIKKNILFDLKNKKYLDSINLLQQCQWYPLTLLCQDIQQIVSNNITDVNLVSEPIVNQEIIDKLFTDFEKVPSNFKKSDPYNLICNCAKLFNNDNYRLTKEQIFEYMIDYVQS